MVIELKKFSHNARLSEETNAFTADLYIDGKNVGYAKNDGQGGSTEYHWHTKKDGEIIAQAELFCLGLPPHTYPATPHSRAMTFNMTLEFHIDLLVEAELKKKVTKAFDKKMAQSVMWGVPGAMEYKEVKFRIPLAQVPLAQLQGYINGYKAKFKTGEQFLNTNLTALGVIL